MFNYHNYKYYKNPWYLSNQSNQYDNINKHVSIHSREQNIKKENDFNRENNSNTKNIDSSQIDNLNNISNEALFDIFGLKIYFDDLLLVCVLLFLYQEKIQDEYLYIALILLLLS